jgi:hypothetical protein
MNNRLLYFFAAILLPVTIIGQQLENAGFEEWEVVVAEIEEPVDWNSIKTADDPDIADLAPVTFERVTDAHSGDYALKLFNVYAFGLTATGAICNGRFHAEFDLSATYSFTDSTDARWHTPFTWRPDSLTGWFKFFPQEDDICQFKVILHEKECKLPENGTMENWIGLAVYQSPPGVTYEGWTRFSVPFEYFHESKYPRYLLCVINSGDSTEASVGSELILDDLEMIYNNAGIGDGAITSDFIRVAGRNLYLSLDSNHPLTGNVLQIIDLNGRSIYSHTLSGNELLILPSQIPPGIYLATLNTGKERYVQKFCLGL